MKVCFIVSDLSRSGGVDVLVQHAQGLAADHGLDVELVTASEQGPAAGSAPACPVRSPAEAAARGYDVAIATWWETAALMWHVPARRRLVLLQSAEECFYTLEQPFERLGAALAQRTADGYIVVSSWLAGLIGELRPAAPVELVPNGIDKSIFDGRRSPGDGASLRVLVEGQPSLWFKGVDEALAAVSAVEAPLDVTLVCPDPAEANGLPVDRVVGGLAPGEMADVYASSDLVVKLSRLEGLGLAPLEAFHHGVPCVVTPYGGHADYVRHGENGFVVGFDDPATVTALVERLARDAELRGRLSDGARETAGAWPDRERSTARFAAALAALEGQDAPPPVPPALDAWRAVAEQERPSARADVEELRESLAWHEAALAETRGDLDEQIDHVARLNALVAELEESRKHINALVLKREAELEELRATRAYRMVVAARTLVDRVRP